MIVKTPFNNGKLYKHSFTNLINIKKMKGGEEEQQNLKRSF